MLKRLLKYLYLIIVVLIELFFYLKSRPENLEAFFMLWGFIYLVLLLFNVFNIKSDGALMGIGGTGIGGSSYGHSMGWLAEKMYGTEKSKYRSGGGLFDSLNLVYLIFIIINVLLYIRVMPR